MLRLVLAAPLAAVLLSPTPAEANSCALALPVVDVREVPVGCPAVILTSQRFGRPLDNQVTANVDGVDVTGTIERATTTREVEIYRYETPETCDLVRHVEQEQFDTVSLELVGVQAGDTVVIADGAGYGSDVVIVAAAPCPASDPQPLTCAEPIQYCDQETDDLPDESEGGCAAGGAGAPGAALALLALVRRRRRA